MREKRTVKKLSKKEFIEYDASKNKMTVEEHKRMMRAIPCNCGVWCCRGWITESRLKSKPKKI
jgi:hypothetical protein